MNTGWPDSGPDDETSKSELLGMLVELLSITEYTTFGNVQGGLRRWQKISARVQDIRDGDQV